MNDSFEVDFDNQQNIEEQVKILNNYKLPKGWSVEIENNYQLTVTSSIKDVKFDIGVLSGSEIWACEYENIKTKVGEWTRTVAYNSPTQSDKECSTDNFTLFVLYEKDNSGVSVVSKLSSFNKYKKSDSALNRLLDEADEFVESIEINSMYKN